MANLHVQPKRKNYLWLLILVIILIIAAGVYYYINYYSKSVSPAPDNTFNNTSLQLKTAEVACSKPLHCFL